MAKYKKVDTDLKFVDREKEVEKFCQKKMGEFHNSPICHILKRMER